MNVLKPLGRFEDVLWKNEPVDDEPQILLSRFGYWLLNGCETEISQIYAIKKMRTFNGLFAAKIEEYQVQYHWDVRFRFITLGRDHWWDVVPVEAR